VFIKNLAIFFLFPSKEFLPISFKIQLLEISPQKQKEQTQKQIGADNLLPRKYGSLKFYVSFFLMFFPLLSILNSLQSSLTTVFTFCQVRLLVVSIVAIISSPPPAPTPCVITEPG
jgi:hypothetical protein